MKYIITCLLFAFALSLALQNCARAKYRSPNDPHATQQSAQTDSALRAHEINAMRAELDAMQAQTDSANARIDAMIKRIARNSQKASQEAAQSAQCAHATHATQINDSITIQINKSVTDHE